MIKQGINDDILEKKFKILRTSIMLGNVQNRDEIMSAYEDTAKEIDRVRRGIYEEKIAGNMYTTTTLEEEKDRLSELINLTESRIKERNDFIDDYIKITNNFLDDLPRVSNEEELPQYRDRLDSINKYLHNCEEIKLLEEQLMHKKNELEDKYESKANNELINAKLEDELIDEFSKMISEDEYFASLNYSDIDNELVRIEAVLNDKKDVMNTFISSYDALQNAGISGSERDEYLSYVNDAKKDYYNELEKKYMLNIYKVVLDKKHDYDSLFQKRLYIDNIIKDRIRSREALGIPLSDKIEHFVNICNEQFSIIKAQKINIENIQKLVLEIAECENRLEKLDSENDSANVVNLLNEYEIEKPEIEKIEMPNEDAINEKVINENISTDTSIDDNLPKPNNMVVSIKDPIKINIKNATDTAKLVMKKVVIVLEPKRFNNKRDKLKEAEKQLEEIKQRSKEAPVIEAVYEDEDKNDLNLFDDKVKDIEEKVSKKDETEEDSPFVTYDVSNETGDKSDNIFVQDSGDNITLNLDTKEMEDAKDTFTTDQIKLNVADGNNVSVPTEIFIEEPPEEKTPDLFSETDPFLDDNQYEIENSGETEESASIMPKIGSIGTVKPTSMLSKIEEAAKENEDVILPTMGLADTDKTNVPIVSENYIN